MAIKIPENITFIYKLLVNRFNNDFYPSFPVDPLGSNISTARDWAGKDYSEHNCENLFKSIKIIHLDERGNGGRAYQVLVTPQNDSSKKFLVDLREDVIMDILIRKGVLVGGIVEEDFVVIMEGSSTKLILKDSDKYLEGLKDNLKRSAGKIKPSTLKLGNCYESLSGKKGVYLGKHNKEYVFLTGFSEKDQFNNLMSPDYVVGLGGSCTSYIAYGVLAYWDIKAMKSFSYSQDNGYFFGKDLFSYDILIKRVYESLEFYLKRYKANASSTWTKHALSKEIESLNYNFNEVLEVIKTIKGE